MSSPQLIADVCHLVSQTSLLIFITYATFLAGIFVQSKAFTLRIDACFLRDLLRCLLVTCNVNVSSSQLIADVCHLVSQTSLLIFSAYATFLAGIFVQSKAFTLRIDACVLRALLRCLL